MLEVIKSPKSESPNLLHRLNADLIIPLLDRYCHAFFLQTLAENAVSPIILGAIAIGHRAWYEFYDGHYRVSQNLVLV